MPSTLSLRLSCVLVFSMAGCGDNRPIGDAGPRPDTGVLPTIDAGEGRDAGPGVDASPPGDDGGTPRDAGAGLDAGSPRDAGTDAGSPDPDAGTVIEPRINELVFNHVGTDENEYIEVLGPASTSLSAFTLLLLEGDSETTTGSMGNIDDAIPLGVTDPAGYWTSGFLVNDLENGTVTVLLVEGFTGTLNQDLDTDEIASGTNRGTIDSAPWTRIVDAIAIHDGGATDLTYAAPVLDASFDGLEITPGALSRIPNGRDTDTVGDWVRNDFDGAGLPLYPAAAADIGEAVNTPGAPNRVQL